MQSVSMNAARGVGALRPATAAPVAAALTVGLVLGGAVLLAGLNLGTRPGDALDRKSVV